MKKKTLAVLMMFLITLSSISANRVFASEGIQVYMNLKQINLTTEPELIDGSVLVPMRSILEALGASVDWDGNSGTVRAKSDSTEITMVIGQKEAFVNNSSVMLSTPPIIRNGSTLVPLRFIAEALQTSVFWDSAEKNVYIYTTSFTNIIREKVRNGQLKELVGYNFGDLVSASDRNKLVADSQAGTPMLRQDYGGLYFGGYGPELKLSGVYLRRGNFFGIQIGKDSGRRLVELLGEPAAEGELALGDYAYCITYYFDNGIEIYAEYHDPYYKTLTSIDILNKSVK